MASETVYYDKGWVGLAVGDSAPGASDALEVYGNPNIRRVPTVLDDRSYTPQGDAKQSVIGREVAQVSLGTLRAQEFTVPTSDGARPNYDRPLRLGGYTVAWADKRSVSAEDTGLDGNSSKTVFVFFTAEFPIKAGTSFTVTDGTQTITVGTDDAVSGDGEATFDRLTGYVKATFDAAPGAVNITVSYTSGYRYRYSRSNTDAGLPHGYAWVTRLQEELDQEDVRRSSGVRLSNPFTIGSAQNLEWTLQGQGSALAQTENDPALTPSYAHNEASLVWDEDARFALYTVVDDGANSKLYIGHCPTISIDPGFSVVEALGAISPGYTHAAQLRPTDPQVTVQLYTQVAAHMDLEALMVARTQFNCRFAVPGRVSASNVLGGGFRGQVIALGEPQEGPNGREVVEVTFKLLTMGNTYTTTPSASAARHFWQVATTV